MHLLPARNHRAHRILRAVFTIYGTGFRQSPPEWRL